MAEVASTRQLGAPVIEVGEAALGAARLPPFPLHTSEGSDGGWVSLEQVLRETPMAQDRAAKALESFLGSSDSSLLDADR